MYPLGMKRNMMRMGDAVRYFEVLIDKRFLLVDHVKSKRVKD